MAELERKKKIFVGDQGNRATVTEEDKSPVSEEALAANSYIAQAGMLFKPIDAKYLGSASVHYYSIGEDGFNPNFICVCQTSVKNVTERHADIGEKQLKSALMRSYGRKEPKQRD